MGLGSSLKPLMGLGLSSFFFVVGSSISFLVEFNSLCHFGLWCNTVTFYTSTDVNQMSYKTLDNKRSNKVSYCKWTINYHANYCLLALMFNQLLVSQWFVGVGIKPLTFIYFCKKKKKFKSQFSRYKIRMILFDQAYKRQTISRCKICIQAERNTLFKL